MLNSQNLNFDNSPSYWERRYKNNGTSGSGSYGRLSIFKAQTLNNFIQKNAIESVIEFGSGDGNQLTLAKYPNYIGVDVSQSAINLCKQKFQGDNTKSFFHSSEYRDQTAQLSLSLDVIYHLIEDEIYSQYMENLFNAASRIVVIYSSNYTDEKYEGTHVRHRCFTDWIKDNRSDFHLIGKLENPYPYDPENPDNTTSADFYFFQKQSQ